MPVDPVSAGLSLAQGAISGISGLSKLAKAKRLEKDNIRPVYKIPQELEANKAQADMLAQGGLPSEQYGKAQQDISRNQTAATNAATDKRAGIGTIGAIQQGSNDATSSLNEKSAAVKIGNIREAMQQGEVLAAARDKAFNYNEKAKFEENAAAIRALKGAGNAELGDAANKILGGAAVAAKGAMGKTSPASSSAAATSSTKVNLQDPSAYYNNQAPTVDVPKDATKEGDMFGMFANSNYLDFFHQFNMGGQGGL